MYEKTGAKDYQSTTFEKRPSTSYCEERKSKRSSEIITPIELKEARNTPLRKLKEPLEEDKSPDVLESTGKSPIE